MLARDHIASRCLGRLEEREHCIVPFRRALLILHAIRHRYECRAVLGKDRRGLRRLRSPGIRDATFARSPPPPASGCLGFQLQQPTNTILGNTFVKHDSYRLARVGGTCQEKLHLLGRDERVVGGGDDRTIGVRIAADKARTCSYKVSMSDG